ncbi:MAG: HlyD family efflux transporter periplasmic adaptor subunit [Pseudomonadota bacterium]
MSVIQAKSRAAQPPRRRRIAPKNPANNPGQGPVGTPTKAAKPAVEGSLDGKSPQAGAQQAPKKPDFAATLLAFETGVRGLKKEAELFAHLTNEARRVLGFRQAFVLRRPVKKAPFKVVNASSIPVIDREAPMIRWIEKLTRRLISDVGEADQHIFSLPAYCDANDEEKSTYPFTEFCWTPIRDGEAVVGGYVVTREVPWTKNDLALMTRLCDVYGHSWMAIHGRGRLTRARLVTRKRSLVAGLVLAAIAMIPVPITALAPAEVSPAEPFIVAAPFNGVVKSILVDQSATITSGEPIVAFEDVRQRNEFEIADRQAAVTAARLQGVAQRAIADPQVKRDLAVAQAEFDLATVERDYAAELLAKTTLYAPQDGIAVYSDKRDWVGRPVAAGEAILEIADPRNVQFTIDLPVDESIVLKEGARVKVFLDSDPLNPIAATLTRTSYEPRTDDRNIMSYRLSAHLDETGETLPRIGIQGTAQVYGQKAPVIYAVLRRPLAALRQMTGL